MRDSGPFNKVFRSTGLVYPARHRDRRDPRESDGRELDSRFIFPEIPGTGTPLKLNTVPTPVLGSSMDMDYSKSRTNRVLEYLLGSVALLLVLQYWMLSLIPVLGGLLGFDLSVLWDYSTLSFLISFYGGHLFGWCTAWIKGHGWNMGTVAIGLFWLGLLMRVPIGWLAHLFIG